MIGTYTHPERLQLIDVCKRVQREHPAYEWQEMMDALVTREVPATDAEPRIRELIRIATDNGISLDRV